MRGILLLALTITGCATASPDLKTLSDAEAARALPALRAQCAAATLPRLPGGAEFWTAFCDAARAIPATDHDGFRALIATRFRAEPVPRAGLLTGYFEPVYAASRTPEPGLVPVRARPPGLVDVDEGVFLPGRTGRRLRGCVADGALSPCPERAAIEAGVMPEAPALAWMDRNDKFFLQIQGSGRLRFDDGAQLRLGYAAQNGAPYVAIGRLLLDRGLIARPVSMQSIRAWLEAHPEAARALLDENPSYVFFRPLDLPSAAGPVGALGVPLTAGRSIAVDPRHIPIGSPILLAPDGEAPRLVFAQDVGGAIRGEGRADLFTGTGAEAGEVAGRLVRRARLLVLLACPDQAPPNGAAIPGCPAP